MSRPTPRERGAVAVEMAIVLPFLLLVIAGIIDLGRLLFTQAIVTNSAREGVRMIALGYTPADAQTRVTVSSPGVQGGPLVSSVVQACPANPGPTSDARVTVTTTDFEWVILGNVAAFFGAAPTAPQPTSTASMRCLG